MMKNNEVSSATAHPDPNGGTEYRIWTGPATYRVVGKFAAWPLMTADERAHAEALEAIRKAERAAASDNATAWRHIMRGG